MLVVVFCNQLLPSLLFNRTRGRWVARLVWPIRLLLWLMTPITVFVRFFFSVASLAEEPVSAEEETAVDVEALLEAGEEEGILEESDRDLVRSAVEFGDKLVREVMTPRPAVFAVPESITLEEFLELLREHNFSRVPVYSARSTTSPASPSPTTCCRSPTRRPAPAPSPASSARPFSFLKPSAATSCCARCSAKSSTCASSSTSTAAWPAWSPSRICWKQIVGNIRDEHEVETPIEEPQREPNGVWLVPGNFPVDQLSDLIGEPVELGEAYEATTLGGLVSEIEGRIPLAGEVVMLEPIGLRMEIVVSTDRRVERLRVFPPGAKPVAEPPHLLVRANFRSGVGTRLPRPPLLGRNLPNLRRQPPRHVVLFPMATSRMPCFSEMRREVVLPTAFETRSTSNPSVSNQ